MADKTYKMTVGLSNGTILDAGTFVAPQGPQGLRGATGPRGPEGPQGPEGPAGGIGKWEEIKDATHSVLPDGTYLMKIQNQSFICELTNGDSGTILMQLAINSNMKVISGAFLRFRNGTLNHGWRVEMRVETNGSITFTQEELTLPDTIYIINLV